MSWANDNIFSRWVHMWTDEGIAHCGAIIAEKDRLYLEKLLATTAAAKIKADVKQILEPLWAVQKKKSTPKALPFTRPAPTAPIAKASPAPIAKASPDPIAKTNTAPTRPCCIGCKKFQIHPNPPPHFTAEDMAHCCALCRLSSGKRHGDHCSRQKA